MTPVTNMEEGRKILASLPYLPERIDLFLEWLHREPCTHPDNKNLPELALEKMETGRKEGVCLILSNIRAMCPACRLRMVFFQSVYNAEAYRPELGEGRFGGAEGF